jgi:hypothetical protein
MQPALDLSVDAKSLFERDEFPFGARFPRYNMYVLYITEYSTVQYWYTPTDIKKMKTDHVET